MCPVVIGRDRELALLGETLDRAAGGGGGTVVLCGEAGVGKTRLAREVVNAGAARSMTTLVGRCVQHGFSPYRPLTEALFPVARRGPLPDAPELRAFRHALGTLVPDWRTGEGPAEESAVIVGEGLLRLLRSVGGTGGTLLVVEDVHWADPDTLAVLEYLADGLASQPAVVLLTLRSEEPGAATEMVGRLEVRGAAQVIALGRLDGREVAAMAAACTGASELSHEVVDAVTRRSDGLPLLVEELLSVPLSGISDAVPDSFAEAVTRRMAALPATSVLVLQCAAVLGRRFDWRLLTAVAGLDDAAVRRGLEDGAAVQLLGTEPDGAFVFRHALTRDAILRGLLPPTREALARRAAQAIGQGPEDDDRAALAADLWVTAGDVDAAAAHLLAAGRRATARGGLVAAERLLDRARGLPSAHEEIRMEVAEALAEALALAAKLDRALVVGDEALRAFEASGAPAPRRARLHLALARAAGAATRWALARDHLALARRLAAEADDATLLARVDALAAHVAMGEVRLDEAEELARRAAAAAAALGLPEVSCEALEVLGRRERLRDLSAAAAFFEQAHDIARRSGLAFWSIRALHELGTIDMFERSSPDRLLLASELAYRSGALAVAATVDLQLAGLYGFRFMVDEAVEAGERAVEVARSLGLSQVHSTTLLQLAFAHAIAGRGDAVEAAVDAAMAVSGDHPETLALAWGHARATYSLLAEDRARAAEQFELAMTWVRRTPGVPGVFPSLWALLRALDGTGAEAIREVAGGEAETVPISRAILTLAAAVVAGRAGEAQEAEASFAAADVLLRGRSMEGMRHLARRLVAEAALADGWGDPTAWLMEALAHFEASGHERVAAACRDLLRRAGQRVPKGGESALPTPLRAAGITGREAEVLRLVGERLSNREIAERLYLSPRTVEKHVERLLQKTDVPTRVELARFAREAFAAST